MRLALQLDIDEASGQFQDIGESGNGLAVGQTGQFTGFHSAQASRAYRRAVQLVIVEHHADTVLGGLDIEFEAVHAGAQGGLEGLHGILEMLGGVAAVAKDQGHGSLRKGCSKGAGGRPGGGFWGKASYWPDQMRTEPSGSLSAP